MAKRPCTSKHPEENHEDEEEEVILEETTEKLGEAYDGQFEDTNEQGTSCDSDYIGYIQHENPSMTMKDLITRKRPRPDMNGYIDHTQARYYDRYKQQDYTRRNDYMKYCHVCRKKVIGKLRVLPGDLRMRKVWILRSNLDEERSAELWLRELACEGSHGGEFCEAHFPPGSREMKGNQLIPIDVRPVEGRHSVLEDIEFDFDSIILQCVFCGRDGALSSMLPFIRNRAKRSRWIETLAAGCTDYKRRLTSSLRGGVTQFICDFHVSDSSFEINGFGEWRLLRNALPDPRLVASDKRGLRVYLVDKCRDELFWERQMWRAADHMSQIGNGEDNDQDELLLANDMQEYLVGSEGGEGEIIPKSPAVLTLQNCVDKKALDDPAQPGTSSAIMRIKVEENSDEGVEYSDDSDEENEMIEKMGDIPYSKRLCQVCSDVESTGTTFPYKSNIRTWPFDEFRHKKWLEIMDWPAEFEESMKTLWQKRKTEGSLTDAYHFCPINVCQSHLDFRHLPERMEQWHKTFCVLCDSCMSSESLLVPLPHDLDTRQRWVANLFPFDESSKFHVKKVLWLRRRLLRPKPTRYRICVYHFSRKAFISKESGEIMLNREAVPLPMDSDDFDVTPRGPNSVCKCLLCDDWKKVEEMVPLRNPGSESERNFLIDTLIHTEKMVVKKALSALAKASDRTALICSYHYCDNVDPFSIIAERRLMYGVQSECVLCAHANDCTTMIPFPGHEDEKLRTKWINSMCREPWIYRYLSTRLEKRGRHYLCSSHFNRNSLRYHPGLGLWKRASATPVLACTTEEERQEVWDLSKSQPLYHPLVIETFDTDGFAPLDYDDVASFLGKERMMEIEHELNFHGRQDAIATRERREKRKKNQLIGGPRGMFDDMPDIYEPDEEEELQDEIHEEIHEEIHDEIHEIQDGQVVREEIIYSDGQLVGEEVVIDGDQ